MATITFGTKKGGAWKSMSCLNLAGVIANKGFTVCVLDADTNETSSQFIDRRNDYNDEQRAKGLEPVPFIKSELKRPDSNLTEDIRDLDAKFDYVLVDTGGYENKAFKTAVGISDIVYMPFLPCRVDMEQLAPTLKVVVEIESMMQSVYPEYKIDARLLITGIDQYSTDLHQAAKEMVKGLIPYASLSSCVIRSVKRVRDTQGDGLTLADIKHPRRAMYEMLFDEINGDRKVGVERGVIDG